MSMDTGWVDPIRPLFTSKEDGDTIKAALEAFIKTYNDSMTALSARLNMAFAEYVLAPALSGNTQYSPSIVLPYSQLAINDGSGKIANSGGIITLKKGIYNCNCSLRMDSSGGGDACFGYYTGGSAVNLINAPGGNVNVQWIMNVTAASQQFFMSAVKNYIVLPTTTPQGRLVIRQIA